MRGEQSTALIGSPTVVITNNGPHTSDVVAKLCTRKLVHVAADAAPHLKLQAQMFTDRLYETIAMYMRQVAENERERIALNLQAHNQPELAARVRAGEI